MRHSSPLDLVVGHFCSEGFSVSVVDGVVWLSRPGFRGAAWVVPLGGGLDEVLWAVMGATEYANKFGASYVALPTHLARRIDESHFWTYGIGLIVYDEGSVREVLQPRPRSVSDEHPVEMVDENGSDVEPSGGLDRELFAEMLRRIERLERELERLEALEARLGALERSLGERERLAHPTPRVEARNTSERASERLRASSTPSEENLPSFLRDNPWIEVLAAKR